MSPVLVAAPADSAMVYEEGTHFVELNIPIHTNDTKRIEVAEYFSYGCPHCYHFEPQIGAWHQQLPKDVTFVRTPAIWNKDYQIYAQTYYTEQALGILEKTHTALFNAIHSEHRRLNSPEAMAEFFADYGVDPKDFARAYNSFGVRASVQQADSKGRAYRSSGVPAIIVNGKYRVEGGMAGSNTNMLKIVDFLIEKERRAMAGS